MLNKFELLISLIIIFCVIIKNSSSLQNESSDDDIYNDNFQLAFNQQSPLSSDQQQQQHNHQQIEQENKINSPNITITKNSPKYQDPCENDDNDDDNDYDIDLKPRNNKINCIKIPENTTDNYEQCGGQNYYNLNIKLSDNQTTDRIEYPWIVAILKNHINSKPIYYAGGTLIHPQFVLTVAHRFINYPINTFIIRAGILNLNNDDKEQDRNIDKIIIHEDFNQQKLSFDIALIKLIKSFELTNIVRTICLPLTFMNFDNKLCKVIGWSTNNNILKLKDLFIINNQECESNIRKIKYRPQFQLSPTLLCAGNEIGKDACQGDGGSSLVCNNYENSMNYYLVGIVAGGISYDCGRQNIPGIYVNVAYLRSWIDRKIIDNGGSNYSYIPHSN